MAGVCGCVLTFWVCVFPRCVDDNVSTGLAYNIRGRATRIEVGVGDALATFQDPIKALFGTRICGGKSVVITRKYVVGGKAVPTPERAPARVVKVQEDVRKVDLIRYGADLEMNLNLFLKPADAKYEMDLKLDAQKKALEKELMHMGYQAIMRDGIRLQDAIVRSMPNVIGRPLGSNANKIQAERVYKHSVFGAFQRHEFPLQNLIAAAKNASAYRNVVGEGSIMILPHASPDLISWTKPCHMEYSITGVSHASKKDVTMKLDNAYVEPMCGIKIMVHHPQADSSFGSVQKVRGDHPLTRKVTIIGEYPNAVNITDFETGRTKANPHADNGNHLRKVTFWMSSAIIGKPGAETGELLVGYPFTSVSTNQRTESLTIGLRVYLGAVLKQIENVIVLPDVHFDGFCSDEDITKAEYEAEHEESPPGQFTGYDGDDNLQERGTTVLADFDSLEHAAETAGLQVYRSRVTQTKAIN